MKKEPIILPYQEELDSIVNEPAKDWAKEEPVRPSIVNTAHQQRAAKERRLANAGLAVVIWFVVLIAASILVATGKADALEADIILIPLSIWMGIELGGVLR